MTHFPLEGALSFSFSSHSASGFRKDPNSYLELLAYLLDSKHLCKEILLDDWCITYAGCRNGLSPFPRPDINAHSIAPDFVFIRADRISSGVPMMLDAINLDFFYLNN